MTRLRKLQAHYSEDPAELVRQIQEFERSVDESFAADARPNIIIRFLDGRTYNTLDVMEFEVSDEGFGISSNGTTLGVSRSGMYQLNNHTRYNHIEANVRSFAAIRTVVNGELRGTAILRATTAGTNDNVNIQASILVRINEGEGVQFLCHVDPDAGRMLTREDTGANHPRISLAWVSE